MAKSSVSKTRRAKGEGSIVQLPDGRWMGRYWVTKSDGWKKQQSITLKDKAKVEERMRYEIAMADRGSPILREKHTTGEYLRHWLRYIAPNQLRPSTLALYEFDTEKYLIPHLGKIPLTQLGPQHIRMMLNKMQKQGCGLRTMQRILNSTLSSALREAQRLELVMRNAAHLVDAPKYKAPERDYWTKSQAVQFREDEKAKKHKYYAAFLLYLFCGMRRGEVLGLGQQHLDFENNIIKIRRSLIFIHNKPCFEEPKTEAGNRDLPMLPFVKEALLAHLASAPKYPDDLVFHSSRGNPVNGNTIRLNFKRLARRIGLPPIDIHEGRHTAATMLVEAWSNPKDVQGILGHADIKTTLGIYAHSNLANKRNAFNALAQGMTSPGNNLEESIIEIPAEAPKNLTQLLYRTA